MNAELKSGSTLGRYELLTRIGRGGMASVWVAREKAPVSGKQRLVAVKAMLPELARRSDFRSMFLEEGQIVRSIDHPNVVKVHEVSEDHGTLYMAMEWVLGDSLRAVIKEAKRRRAIPAEMAVKIIADTAAGLHAAHELRGWDGELRNVVHCDVSPHNILVGLDGQAKLVDFGVANATLHSVIDAEDEIKGKFGYMSPEQASAGQLDRRTDVFSLGIVLFELTTGERLFRGEDPAQTLELVKNGRIPAPKEIYPKYPDGLAMVVKRALSRDVNERFQTAAEFRDALEHYLKDERIMVSHASVGQLVKRVLGSRIEEQRQALREALTGADGAVVSGLLPDQPAARAPDAPEPRPRTLNESEPEKTDFLPLFAALGGLVAAAGAIFWVTHRAGPAPLITTSLGATHAVSRAAARDNSPDPASVDIDSLPTARAAQREPSSPSAEAMTDAPSGGKTPAEQSAAGKKPALAEKPTTALKPTSQPKEQSSADFAPPQPARSAAALPPNSERAPLNRGAAMAVLSSAASSAAGCKREDGPTGSGTATITFSPDGPVSSVNVSAPFAGTAVGDCVSTVFRGAQVPPFSGSSFTLPKSFQIRE